MLLRKKVQSYFILISIICFCFGCKTQQTNSKFSNAPKVSEKIIDGKCYSKCLMPNQYEIKHKEYLAYVGDEETINDNLEKQVIITQPKETKWVKKKADRNCKSKDPNDCLVWCLVEVPAEKETIWVVKDTTQIRAFELKEIQYKELVRKGGYTEEKEVLCSTKQTPEIINQIQEELKKRDYYKTKNTSKLDALTKAALSKFQRANRLPVGKLDLETVKTLGIKIE